MTNKKAKRPYMMHSVVLAASLGLIACSDSKPKQQPAGLEALPAGPVPVALANIDAKRLRAITGAKEFVVIDLRGNMRRGKPQGGPTPWAGEPAQRRHNVGASIEYDFDSYGTLSRDSSTAALILADTATPARITLVDGIQAYGYTPVALAAGAANLAVPYSFGSEPWQDIDVHADVAVRADQLQLGDQKPRTVLLQFTDATTTGEVLSALTAIAETGAERVRLHRMMGWGEIGPSDIVWVNGPESDDDEITVGTPANISIERVRVDDNVTEPAVNTALLGIAPRFRYCYEKSSVTVPASLELSFDVAADGGIANATAKGPNRALESCVAGAMFDRRVASEGVKGAGHATASVAFARGSGNPSASKEPKLGTGFWCWVHQSGRRGMCARDKEECEALSSAFNQVAPASHETPNSNECKAQKTAWEASGPSRATYPTKALCKTLEVDASCRQVR